MKTRINRKAEEKTMHTLISLIILGVSLIGIIALYASSQAGLSEWAEKQACRNTVLLRNEVTFSSFGTILAYTSNALENDKLLPLNCPSEDLGRLNGNREEQKQELADKAAQCWYMYAEGKVDNIFDVESTNSDEPADRRGCNVCFEFKYDSEKPNIYEPEFNFINEQRSRTENTITFEELMNYMAGTRYNPPILYGGRSVYYYGHVQEINLPIEIERPAIRSDQEIAGAPVNSFVRDYSYRLDEDTIQSIDEIGDQMIQKNRGNLFVLVAEQFETMERANAIRIIERLRIDTRDREGKIDRYDAVFIMVDLKNQSVRVLVGRDLDHMIKEAEIVKIVANTANRYKGTQDINGFVEDLTYSIGNQVLSFQEAEFITRSKMRANSYYYYVSNAGNYPPTVMDIQEGYNYYIGFMSNTTYKSWSQAMDLTPTPITSFSGTPIAGANLGHFLGTSLALSYTVRDVPENMLIIAREDLLEDYCEIYN